MKLFIILLLFTNILFSKVQIILPYSHVNNGATFAILLKSDEKLKFAPNVLFNDKTYQMFSRFGLANSYEVFLPISYHMKKTKHKVQVFYKKDSKKILKTLYINVIQGKYKQNEVIKVKKGKVTLSKKNKIKASLEYSKVFNNVYSKINSKNKITKTKFNKPIQSKITSAYGTARIYNKKVKNYHTGVDFRAKMNTKIYSSNGGVVALVMKRFYLGNVVYIDHGRGAYSYYAHMNKIIVKKGDSITKGTLLGYSGKTGRVTAPHLHYAFRLYNVTVDPLQFSSLHNELINKY